MHQEFLRGTVTSVSALAFEERGEFTVMLGPDLARPELPVERPTDAELAVKLGEMADKGGLSRRDAVRQLASFYGMAPNELYAAVERGHREGQMTNSRGEEA